MSPQLKPARPGERRGRTAAPLTSAAGIWGRTQGRQAGLTLSELSAAVTGNRRKAVALHPLPARGLPLCFGCKSGLSSPSEPAVTRGTSHWPHWSMGCTLKHPTPMGVPGGTVPQGPVSQPWDGMGWEGLSRILISAPAAVCDTNCSSHSNLF